MTKTMTVRIDANDKTNFDNFCKSVGLTPSAAINLFVKKTLRERRIPFEIDDDPFYSIENQERLKKNIELTKKNGGTIHEVDLDA